MWLLALLPSTLEEFETKARFVVRRRMMVIDSEKIVKRSRCAFLKQEHAKEEALAFFGMNSVCSSDVGCLPERCRAIVINDWIPFFSRFPDFLLLLNMKY